MLTLIQCDETSGLLVERHSCHLDLVGVVVGLQSILIGASRHEQISGENMHISILRVSQYESLEVQKRQVCVAKQVSAQPSKLKCLKERVIQRQRNREIFHSLSKDGKASVGTSSSQVEHGIIFFFGANRIIKVLQCIIKSMQLVI